MNHDLPQTWIEVPFGELNQFASKTVDPAEFPQETFELYSVPSFPSDKPEIVVGASIGSTKQSVEPYDVLVCKINPRINRVWQVGPAQQNRQIASSEWIGFRCHLLETRFFRHFFSSPDFRELICTDVTGVGGSLTRAQPKKVATFSVPVAPLSEQTRIADKLDAVLARVDACRDRLDRIPAILKRFHQSVLVAATSGALTEDWRGSNKSAYKQVPLGTLIADGPQNGLYKHSSAYGKGTGILRIDMFYDGEVTGWDAMKRLKVDASELDTYGLSVGDIVVNRVNSPPYVGKAALIRELAEPTVFESNMMRIRLDREQVLPEYCIRFLSSLEGLSQLRRNVKHAVNQSSINQTDVKAVQVPLPCLAEQAEIVRRIEILFAFADRLEARYAAARAQVEKLTPSLLAKAFRGELVPQDPNDEPASELLARVRATTGRPTAKATRGRKSATAK